MKLTFAALFFALSTSVFARQYIQCYTTGNSTDVAVVNLQTINGGTLFLSSGMQNPEDERILVNISLAGVEKQNHLYKITHNSITGFVAVPSSQIGKPSDGFLIDLLFNGQAAQFGCFSRLYND